MQKHMGKKINIILPGLGDSGGIKVIHIYKEILESKGWDVQIYCSIVGYNLHRYSSKMKNILHRFYCMVKTVFEINKKKNVKWVPFISDITIRDADFVIATMWATAYEVYKLSSSKGRKYYFIQDFEIWDNKEWGMNSYKLPLKKIVISTWINNQLKKNLNLGPYPVVMNGINNIFYDRGIRDDSTKNILMLNHILEKKGVKYGLKVFEKVKEKYPESKLRMFGMCNRSNLPDYVEYYQNPSKEVLIDLYCTSNYFIFPSLEEGWGLTPIEAMACGCIVIGTSTGFVLDIGKDRENMMISVPGNIESMVSNIIALIESDELKIKIKEHSIKTAYSIRWNQSATKLENILKTD